MSGKRKKKYGKVLAKHGGGVVRKFHTGGLIIYGVGEHLQDMLAWYDDLAGRIIRVVDRDREKIGKKAPGLVCEVESPEVLKGLPAGTWVVVSALRYYDEIVKELHELNPGLVCPNIDQAYTLMKQAEANGILVYGAGAHLADMLSWHPTLKDRIGRIFDKDKKKQGAQVFGTGKLVEGFDKLKHLPAGTQIAVSAIRYLHEIAEEVYALNPGLICQHIDDVYSRLSPLPIQTTASVPASPVCEVLEENEVLYFPEVLHKAEEKKIDIVIPIYNALEHLKKCVESLLRNTSVDYELYLINDRSSDAGIEEYLKDLSVCSAPNNLKKLHIIENSSNMGFVKTINKGLKLSSNDVVILNTDTEVPPAWAERFIFTYGNDDKIASITPFSNSATICSFPEFLINNEIYKGKSVEEIDKVFKDCNFDRPIEIPTAVGFCMFMSRKAIDEIGLFDEIFGHGYGEENDWCMRAAQKGYKNVFLPNLYVYHKHGASFNDKGSKKREELRNKNHDILIDKYPTYDAEIQRYINKDPADKIRKIIRWRLDSVGEPVLLIMPRLEGGVKVYQEMQIERVKAKRTTYAMYLENDLNSLVIENNSLGKEKLVFDFGNMSSDMFARLLNLLGTKEIFINHLIIYPLSKIMGCIMDADIPYTYFVHDFYPVCPKYTLIDIHGKYCGAEKSGNVCDKCFYKYENSSDCIETAEPISNIYTYRSLWNYFLQNAKKIIAPSQFVKSIMGKYYPTCKVEVKEHTLGNEIRKTFREDFSKDEVLVVSVLGAINEVKGYDVIFDLTERIYESNYKILINVIGAMKGHDEAFEEFDGMLCCRGRYKRENVSLILAEYKTGIVLIPSICPETFSYTTHEAVESGYPVLCFDIGAQGEFVKKSGCGWALSEINVDALYEKLVFLYKNRDEIAKKSRWQRIDNVVLNFETYSPDKDIYSDGDIENEILQIVKDNREDEVLNKDNRWPILYHFSKTRQNILSWYSFKDNAKLLEIGTGCGAITGLFCARNLQVTGVESSKRRATITAYRNKGVENLQIHVGNFLDMKFENQFDYITMIGVLEYSNMFLPGSDNAFREMLEHCKCLLKEDGKIFIAIGNRLGMKYFAGAAEDHTARRFDGIEDYPEENGVRTFSRSELQNLISEAGFTQVEWYYPYPDYKLPRQIFSDEFLPTAELLTAGIDAYDNDRIQLFDEMQAIKSLAGTEEFKIFSNSYLLVVGK